MKLALLVLSKEGQPDVYRIFPDRSTAWVNLSTYCHDELRRLGGAGDWGVVGHEAIRRWTAYTGITHAIYDVPAVGMEPPVEEAAVAEEREVRVGRLRRWLGG